MANESTILKGVGLLRANWPQMAVPDDTDDLWVRALQGIDDDDFINAVYAYIETQSRPFWPSVHEIKQYAIRARRERETHSGCGECREGLLYREREDGVRIMYPCPCPASSEKRRWLSGEKDEADEPAVVSIPSRPFGESAS